MIGDWTPPPIVVMGVSGAGKSTVGVQLARALGVVFAEGDDLHPEANVARMAAGVALTDADRWPWLDRIAEWLRQHRDAGGVISCSALRRDYRNRLRGGADDVFFAHLNAERPVLARRMGSRRGHFMPVSLLDSQLATLEPLGAGERGVTLDATRDPDALVRDVLAALRIR